MFRSRALGLRAAAVILAVAFPLLAGCSSATPSVAAPSLNTLTGTIRFPGATGGVSATYPVCRGVPGFGTDGLRTDQQVTVVDEAGTTIGSATLAGTTVPQDPSGMCSATFSMAVPTAKFYSLHFGSRATDQFSYSDLVAKGWRLDLSIPTS